MFWHVQEWMEILIRRWKENGKLFAAFIHHVIEQIWLFTHLRSRTMTAWVEECTRTKIKRTKETLKEIRERHRQEVQRKKVAWSKTKEIGNSTKCEESIETEIEEWFNEWWGIDVKFKSWHIKVHSIRDREQRCMEQRYEIYLAISEQWMRKKEEAETNMNQVSKRATMT